MNRVNRNTTAITKENGKKMKRTEPKCGNCLLYKKEKKECGVAILLDGQTIHMPVDAADNCHMDELGIEVNQVRWWVEDKETGEKTDKDGTVKIEYPDGFFGR
jgi:hypothetical protein